MLTVKDFNMPIDRPWNMLSGYDHASEKENVLSRILMANIEAGKFEPVETKYQHPGMVEDGLLFETEQGYKLTTKALGLLYSVYGNNCQTCNKPHEKTYGENNEWCENCVPY